MKNRQFIVLCCLIVIGFGITGYIINKQHNRIEYVNDRLSFRAEKIMALEEDQKAQDEVIGVHSKELRGNIKKTR